MTDQPDRTDLIRLSTTRLGVPEPHEAQLAAVRSLLAGRDVLLVAPTGSGKSLVYPLAALASDALCVVVTPLLSLAADQVRSLEEHAGEGVAAR
ncbi:MAG: DEAD/DEAH box helicase [Nocardioides sp.]